MSIETVIEPLCMADTLIVKVAHKQRRSVSMNFKTGSSRSKLHDVFEFIYEADGREESVQIPKRLYNALVAFQNPQ
jgi:hypothetical protein